MGIVLKNKFWVDLVLCYIVKVMGDNFFKIFYN